MAKHYPLLSVLPVVLLSLLLLGAGTLHSQSLEKSGDERVGILYEKDLSFGIRLNTNGWGIFSTYGKAHSASRTHYYQFEFVEIKHPKEIKESKDYTTSGGYSPKPFVFGKQNNFFALRAAYGNRVFLGGKAEKSGVEVNWTYQIGPSLGILKPYYLDVEYDRSQDGRIIYAEQLKYDPEDPNSRFLQLPYIVGYSGFSYGLDEIKLVPGLNAKTGFNFDWANYSDYVVALEVGVSVDLYMRDIPIMVLETNRPYFVAIYLGIQFGKRW